VPPCAFMSWMLGTAEIFLSKASWIGSISAITPQHSLHLYNICNTTLTASLGNWFAIVLHISVIWSSLYQIRDTHWWQGYLQHRTHSLGRTRDQWPTRFLSADSSGYKTHSSRFHSTCSDTQSYSRWFTS
jgi:hypothetical protein